MIKRITSIAIFASACTFGEAAGSAVDPSNEVPARGLTSLECISETEQQALSQIYGHVDDSLHEMVACGGAQVSVASNFLAGLVASNEGLFRHQDDYDALERAANSVRIQLRVPFRHGTNGGWSVPMDTTSPDSVFEFEVYEPAPLSLGEGGDTITVDPFVIESYLRGVRVESSLDMDEMLARVSTRTTLTFHWEEEGHLAHLLNRGRPIPNPFDIEFSLIDLVGLSWGFTDVEELSMGPLASLMEVQMESSGVFEDERENVVVSYAFAAPRMSLNETSRSRTVDFDLSELHATDGTFTLRGLSDTIEYVDSGNRLSGQVVFAVEGTERAVQVTADFGDGSAYSSAHWECL